MNAAPRAAALPPRAGLPQAQQTPQTPPVNTAQNTIRLDAADAREYLDIDVNRLRAGEVKARATSLESIGELKGELQAFRAEVDASFQREKKIWLASNDMEGLREATAAHAAMHRELDGAMGFLNGKEQELKPGATKTQSAKPSAPPDAVTAEALGNTSVPWFKPFSMLNPLEKIRHQYNNLKLSIDPNTTPAFTNSQVVAGPKQLGSGVCNTVYAVELSKPDGTRMDGVFKPLNAAEKETIPVLGEMGIPYDNPQTAMRNLATVDYAKALGFDVIADTKVAALSVPPDNQDSPTVGLVMERAQGKAAWATDPEILRLPEVMRETTKLQLLDHLTGQGDRHGENYFVDVRPDGSVKITGIDNDLCFGKNVTSADGIANTGGDCSFRGAHLPLVVDREMADAINKLEPEDLKKMLGDKLTDAEVDASISRLAGVKEHLSLIKGLGGVIERHEWGGEKMQFLTYGNSYAERNAQLQEMERDNKAKEQ